jgi:hypothetical protein
VNSCAPEGQTVPPNEQTEVMSDVKQDEFENHKSPQKDKTEVSPSIYRTGHIL